MLVGRGYRAEREQAPSLAVKKMHIDARELRRTIEYSVGVAIARIRLQVSSEKVRGRQGR